MYALITDGSIAKHLNGNKGIQIGDIKYARDIFSKWTEAERNAIGIYETVTATYGDATAKAHADTTWTQDEIDDGKAPAGADTDTIAIRGLKYNRIQTIKSQAASILQDTDWYIVRKADANTAVPSAITTFRAAVRSKAAAMETLITNASNTAAIETLYTYVNTADEGDPVVMERPLGEFPVLGS